MINCKRCGKQIYFKDKISLNPDGSKHFADCDRAHLFGKSNVKCPHCESRLNRSAGEFREGVGDFFPSADYRLLECPCCNFFHEWYFDKSPLSHEEMEAKLIKENKVIK